MKKILKVLLVLTVLGIVALFGQDYYVKAVGNKNISDLTTLANEPDSKAEAIIILGAGIRADGSLSPMLKERMDTGIELYQAKLAPKLLMSGDHGQKSYDEVNAMKDYAIKAGVPSEDIFMDHAGFSTYDTMYRATEIFEIKHALIVTQKYHLYRALYDAKAFNIQAKGVPCDTQVFSGDLQRKSREVLARVKDVGYTIIKPEPTFLGETIPIAGDGDVTNDQAKVK